MTEPNKTATRGARRRRLWYDDPLVERELARKDSEGPTPELPIVQDGTTTAGVLDAQGRALKRRIGFRPDR